MKYLTNSTFFVILILLFEHEKCYADMLWGCDYDKTENFQLSRLLDTTIPQYGVNITGANFSEQNILNETLQNINILLEEMIGEYMFDTFGDIYRFHDAYMTQVKRKLDDFTNFKSFFMNYKPMKMFPTGSYGLTIFLLRKLIEKYKVFRENVFLATAYKGASESFISMQESRDIMDTFEHNHMAAILKISFSYQDAYIVMDPGSFFRTAVVVPETWTEFSDIKNADGFKFRMLPYTTAGEHGGTIEQKSVMIHAHKKIDDENSTNILYYVGKPFCSLVSITLKKGLLNPHRLLEKRDRAGQMLLRVSTHLLPKIENPMCIIETPKSNTTCYFIITRSNFEFNKFMTFIEDYVPNKDCNKIKDDIRLIGRVARDEQKFTFLDHYKALIEELNASTSS